MSSSSRLRNANATAETERVFALTELRHSLVLRLIHRRGSVSLNGVVEALGMPRDVLGDIVRRLIQAGLVAEDAGFYRVTEEARLRLAFRAASLDFLVGSSLVSEASLQNRLGHSYYIEAIIGYGATSTTFLAKQEGTGQHRTLKVFHPDVTSYEEIERAIRSFIRGTQDFSAIFPDIIEAGECAVVFREGITRVLPCIVLKHIPVTARTFSAFLDSFENLDAALFERFVETVGGALECLEAAGLQHGDLHEGNILVTEGRRNGEPVDFWIIDFIGIPGKASPELEPLSDLTCFHQHLLRASLTAISKYSGYSARFLLGERTHRVLDGLRRGKYSTFAQVMHDFRRPRSPVPLDYFQAPPQPFDWLRVEWIPSPDWLVKLFHQVPSRFETIARFGNTWISGPRGCGKSHYLRVLAFQASLYTNHDESLREKMQALGCDFRKAFGVLFACRLGEFKVFDPEALGADEFDFDTRQFVKHILVLKIINKTLSAIREGLEPRSLGEAAVLSAPASLSPLVEFLASRLGRLALIQPAAVLGTFQQLMGMSIARENSDVSVWNMPHARPAERLGETDLDAFFFSVKQTFSDLRDTKFYILVDDATSGHIHYETQRVLNSLVRSQQANHCFKITFERFMYTLDSADGRAIDPRHEVTYVDLGEISVKSQKDTGFNYSAYMAEVVNLRLRARNWHYTIQDILGVSQGPDEFLSSLSGVRWGEGSVTEERDQRGRRSHADYAGWNIVCSIAHGSVRTLLELVEAIFRGAEATPDTKSIPLRKQDAVVRAYSRRQFRALTLLPGEIGGEPVGQHLQTIISAIGEISRQYLRRYDTGDARRWYETISIERLDQAPLDEKTRRLLDELVKYGLLLKEGVTFTRADIGLGTRYDLNKIFSPAFEITYRVRNHLYLGHRRFEELMLSPDAFVRKHLERFDLAEDVPESDQPSLF